MNTITRLSPQEASDPLLLKETLERPERSLPAPLEQVPAPNIVAHRPSGSPPPPPRLKRTGGRRVALLLAGAIVITAGSWFGYHWWTTGRFIVSTDDAYVGADFTAISPRISGYVTQAQAQTNKAVKAGDPIVTLDDSDGRLAVAAAETQISSQLAAIDPELDFGMEHVEERVEVSVACGGEERVHHPPLSTRVSVWGW